MAHIIEDYTTLDAKKVQLNDVSHVKISTTNSFYTIHTRYEYDDGKVDRWIVRCPENLPCPRGLSTYTSDLNPNKTEFAMSVRLFSKENALDQERKFVSCIESVVSGVRDRISKPEYLVNNRMDPKLSLELPLRSFIKSATVGSIPSMWVSFGCKFRDQERGTGNEVERDRRLVNVPIVDTRGERYTLDQIVGRPLQVDMIIEIKEIRWGKTWKNLVIQPIECRVRFEDTIQGSFLSTKRAPELVAVKEESTKRPCITLEDAAAVEEEEEEEGEEEVE